jgi:hypothetical protein
MESYSTTTTKLVVDKQIVVTIGENEEIVKYGLCMIDRLTREGQQIIDEVEIEYRVDRQ